MALMSWNSRMSVGIATIDAQHQRLVGMLNDLSDSMRSEATDDVLGDVLHRLTDYTVEHFAYEESLMERFKYPKHAAHHRLHEELTAQLTSILTRYQAGDRETLDFEVLNFLKRWLTTHIQGDDRYFGRFLLSSGADPDNP